MAKFVIAGICSCPRYAMVEYVAEYLKATVPSFQVHKITLDEGDPWKLWLHDVCVRNGWMHEESPIVWRELLQRGSKGIYVGNADAFLEYANIYYGLNLKIPTAELLLLAQENNKLHADHELRMHIARDQMQSYVVGVFGACQKTSLMILFRIVREGTLGPNKALILKLYCQTSYGDSLKTIKNDLLDMASPYLRQVVITNDLITVVSSCSLILWLEEPFCVSRIYRTKTTDSTLICHSPAAPTSLHEHPQFDSQYDKIAGTIPKDLRVQAIASWPASDTNYPMVHAMRPDSSISQQPSTSDGEGISSESFLQQIDIHTMSPESLFEENIQRRAFSLEGQLPSTTSKKPSFSTSAENQSRSHKKVSREDPSKKSFMGSGSCTFSELDLRIRGRAELIAKFASFDCRILMAGDDPSLNYCAYIVAQSCPALAPFIIVVSDLEARTRGVIARKLDIRPSELFDVIIWGDPGGEFAVDISRATVLNYDGAIWKEQGFARRLESVFFHWKWFKRELKPQLREEAQRRSLGKSTLCPMLLADSVVTCLKRWYSDHLSPITSLGVVSNGSYGIPKGQVMTCPVYLMKGSWHGATMDMSDVMLQKIGRLVSKCYESQQQYYLKVRKEQFLSAL